MCMLNHRMMLVPTTELSDTVNVVLVNSSLSGVLPLVYLSSTKIEPLPTSSFRDEEGEFLCCLLAGIAVNKTRRALLCSCESRSGLVGHFEGSGKTLVRHVMNCVKTKLLV